MRGLLKYFLENKVQVVAFLVMALLLAYLYFISFSSHATVDIEIRSNIITNFKIYWAKSNELYDEKRSSHVRINYDQIKYRFPIGDLEGIEKLRIDPADGNRKTAKILIKKITISQVGFKQIYVNQRAIHNRLKPVAGIMKTHKSKNGLLVVSSENDPQLELRIAPQKTRSFFSYWAPIGAALLILFLVFKWAFSMEENYIYIRYFLLFVFALVIVMAVTSRQNVHPDEYVHIRASKYYEDHWRPPEICAPGTEHTYSVYGISRLNSLEILYPIAGKFSRVLSFLPIESYLRLRYFNIFLFFTLVLLCFRSREFCIAAAPLLISPQIWYVFSYFNSDAFSLFIIFLLIYQILVPESLFHRYLVENKKNRVLFSGFLLGMLCFAILLSKKNFYFFILFLIAYFIWWLYYQYIKENKPIKTVVKRLALILLVAVTGYALRFSADIYLHGFDKKEKILDCREKLAKSFYKPSSVPTQKHPLMHLRERGKTLEQMFTEYKWNKKTFASSFGVYDYMTISAPKDYYKTAKIAGILFILFIVFSFFFNFGVKEKLIFLIFLIFSTSLLSVHLLRSWEIMFQAQGRHFLPIIGMAGFLFYHLKKHLYQPFVHLYIIFMFLLSVYSFIFIGLVNIPKF